jgi:lipoprotein-anchoring transpeptidase ErfK/SrfK
MPAVTQRGWAALPSTLALVLVMSLVASTPDRASAAGNQRLQELALLLSPHLARSTPDEAGAAVELVRALRPLTAERTTLPVTAHATEGGVHWLQVLLPGRPNGHSGWIKQTATVLTATPWKIVVESEKRRVTVYRSGHLVRTFAAVVGKPSTPTPRGSFFVEESIQLRAGDVGAPYALALSARSTVLQEFDGGPGQIALHGLSNVGGVLGSAVSHGCIRLDDGVMRWLAGRIGPGVPVVVR